MEFPLVWYHLTDRSRFRLDPKFAPEDATFALEDRSGQRGVYLSPEPDVWLASHGYWRPFVAEFIVDQAVVDDRGVHGRWGGEMFVPASSFGRLRLHRVIPLDAYARERFNEPGWIESALGRAFDTGEPLPTVGSPEWIALRRAMRGYRYDGPDVRDLSTESVSVLKRQLRQALPLLRS